MTSCLASSYLCKPKDNHTSPLLNQQPHAPHPLCPQTLPAHCPVTATAAAPQPSLQLLTSGPRFMEKGMFVSSRGEGRDWSLLDNHPPLPPALGLLILPRGCSDHSVYLGNSAAGRVESGQSRAKNCLEKNHDSDQSLADLKHQH